MSPAGQCWTLVSLVLLLLTHCLRAGAMVGTVPIEDPQASFRGATITERIATLHSGNVQRSPGNASGTSGTYHSDTIHWTTPRTAGPGFAIVDMQPIDLHSAELLRVCASRDPVRFRGAPPHMGADTHGLAFGEGVNLLCRELRFEGVCRDSLVDLGSARTKEVEDGGGGRSITLSLRVTNPRSSTLLFAVTDGWFREYSAPADEERLTVRASRRGILIHMLTEELHRILHQQRRDASDTLRHRWRSRIVPQHQRSSWLGAHIDFRVYSFAYFDAPSATLLAGTASPGAGLQVYSWGPAWQLLDGDWHAIALVQTKASETSFLVRLWVDAASDATSDTDFACTDRLQRLASPIRCTISDGADRVAVHDPEHERVVNAGFLFMGPPLGISTELDGLNDTTDARNATDVEVHNLRFHPLPLVQQELVVLGAPWMRENLLVPPIWALAVSAVMLIAALIIGTSMCQSLVAAGRADSDVLTQSDFVPASPQRGSSDTMHFLRDVEAEKTRELRSGASCKLLTSAKDAASAAQFRPVREVASFLPPLVDVLQVQWLLLRGMTRSWPTLFSVPMAFITVPFTMSFNLPTFNVEVPSYAPLTALLILVLFCLTLAAVFSGRDHRRFKLLVEFVLLETAACTELAKLAIRDALHNGDGEPPSSALDAKFHRWACSIVQNGWALSAGALHLLLPDMSTTEARLVNGALGVRPFGAIEAELRRFSAATGEQWTPAGAAALASVLVTASAGSNICSVAQSAGICLHGGTGEALLGSLRSVFLSSGNRDASAPSCAPLLLDAQLCARLRELNQLTNSDVLVAPGDVNAAAARTGETHTVTGVSPAMVYRFLLVDAHGVEWEVLSDEMSPDCADNFGKLHRLLKHVARTGVGWVLPSLLVTSAAANERAVLKNMTVSVGAQTGARGCSPLTLRGAKEGSAVTFDLRVMWKSRLRCPLHGHLLVHADEHHYTARNPDGTRCFHCVHANAPFFHVAAGAGACRADSLLVCPEGPCGSCLYAVCHRCASKELSAIESLRVAFATRWCAFKRDPSAAVALVSYLGLQYAYVPATEEAMMILGCHESVRCQFGHCYSRESWTPDFSASVVVASLMFFTLSVGVPVFWLRSIVRRKRELLRVVRAPAQWEAFLARDTTILSNLYSKYTFRFMPMEPVLLVLRSCGIVAATSLTPPNSLLQLLCVSSVSIGNALLMLLARPHVDRWVDALTKGGLAYSVLQVALVALHQYLLVDEPRSQVMAVPMFIVFSLFVLLYIGVFYQTVVRAALDAHQTTAAKQLQRTEASWLEIADAEDARDALRQVVLPQKQRLFGGTHFQTALTLCHIASSSSESAPYRDREYADAAAALSVALGEVLIRAQQLEGRSGQRERQRGEWGEDAALSGTPSSSVRHQQLRVGAKRRSMLQLYDFDGVPLGALHCVSWNALKQVIIGCPKQDIRDEIISTLHGLALAGTHMSASSSLLCANAMTLLSACATSIADEDFSNANMAGVHLFGKIQSVNFETAILSNADLRDATLCNTNLKGSQLTGVVIAGAYDGSHPQFLLEFPLSEVSPPSHHLVVSTSGDYLAVLAVAPSAVDVVSPFTGNKLFALGSHRDVVVCGAFCPSGSPMPLFACGDVRGNIYLWLLRDNPQRLWHSCLAEAAVGSICFTPDGATFAAGVGTEFRFFSITWRSAASGTPTDPGGQISVCPLDSAEFRTDECTLGGGIFHPNGQFAVAIDISDDSFHFRQWRLNSGVGPCALDEMGKVFRAPGWDFVGVSGRGTVLLTHDARGIARVMVPSLARARPWTVVCEIPFCTDKMIFADDGNLVIAVDAKDAEARVYSALSGELRIRRPLDLARAQIAGCPCASPDGRFLFVCAVNNSDNKKQLLKFALCAQDTSILAGRATDAVHDKEVLQLLRLGSSPMFMSHDGTGSIKVWDSHRGVLHRSIALAERHVECADSDSTGSKIAVAFPGLVAVYDTSSGSELSRSVINKLQQPSALSMSPAGDRIVVTSTDRHDEFFYVFEFAASVVMPTALHRKKGRSDDAATTVSLLSLGDCPSGAAAPLLPVVCETEDELAALALLSASFSGAPGALPRKSSASALCGQSPTNSPRGRPRSDSSSTAQRASSALGLQPTVAYALTLLTVCSATNFSVPRSQFVDTCCFLPNGQQVITGHAEGSILLFNLQSGGRAAGFVRCVRRASSAGAASPSLLRNSHTCTVFATSEARRGGVDAFDTISMTLKFQLDHEGVRSIGCSNDGSLLATASLGSVRVWHVESRVVVHHFSRIPALIAGRTVANNDMRWTAKRVVCSGGVAISADKTTIAIATGSVVSMWSIEPQQPNDAQPDAVVSARAGGFLRPLPPGVETVRDPTLVCFTAFVDPFMRTVLVRRNVSDPHPVEPTLAFHSGDDPGGKEPTDAEMLLRLKGTSSLHAKFIDCWASPLELGKLIASVLGVAATSNKSSVTPPPGSAREQHGSSDLESAVHGTLALPVLLSQHGEEPEEVELAPIRLPSQLRLFRSLLPATAPHPAHSSSSSLTQPEEVPVSSVPRIRHPKPANIVDDDDL